MKKITVVALAFVVLFSGCTVQSAVNPSLLIERFAEKYPEYTVDADSLFYENDKCVLFVQNQNRLRFAVEMTVDSADRVQKISLACIETDKADEFCCFAKNIVEIYAPDEDFSLVEKIIFNGKNYSYHETQWYYYSFSLNESGLCFCIENKQFAPQKDECLTLRENELSITSR